MSDWQQQGYPPPPQQGYAPAPPAYQPPPPGYPPQTGGPYPPGEPPKKKRTGLIIAVVVIAVLLLCCCSAGAGLLLFRAGSSTGTSTSPSPAELAKKKAEERALAARAAAWELVKMAFVKGDYTFVDPNERQRRLATEAVAKLLPDFAIEDLTIEPGHYDKAKHYFYFDTAYVTLHLSSDPTAKTAYSFDIETPEAEADGLKREKLDVSGSDAVIQLEGRTWVIYPTGSKGPLLGGMKDPSYAALIRQACADWPEGLPTRFVDGGDGSVVVSVETWDSYRFSDGFDRLEATYVRSGSGWRLTTYKPVIETGKSGEATPTA